MEAYCIDCKKPMLFLPIFEGGRDAMFCNNPDCYRFGLLTTISTPNKDEEEETEED